MTPVKDMKVLSLDREPVWRWLVEGSYGWAKGQGWMPSEEGLEWLKNSHLALLFLCYGNAEPPLNVAISGPAVFPTLNGDIEFSWQHKDRTAVFKVDLDFKIGCLFVCNHETGHEKDHVFYLDKDSEMWTAIAEIFGFLLDGAERGV